MAKWWHCHARDYLSIWSCQFWNVPRWNSSTIFKPKKKGLISQRLFVHKCVLKRMKLAFDALFFLLLLTVDAKLHVNVMVCSWSVTELKMIIFHSPSLCINCFLFFFSGENVMQFQWFHVHELKYIYIQNTNVISSCVHTLSCFYDINLESNWNHLPQNEVHECQISTQMTEIERERNNSVHTYKEIGVRCGAPFLGLLRSFFIIKIFSRIHMSCAICDFSSWIIAVWLTTWKGNVLIPFLQAT